MSDEIYAAELDDDDRVLRVIVGSAEWASDNLGGRWIDSTDKVGIGWELADDVLRPPAPYPSWVWENGSWNPPVQMPDEGVWDWDEDAGDWLEIIISE